MCQVDSSADNNVKLQVHLFCNNEKVSKIVNEDKQEVLSVVTGLRPRPQEVTTEFGEDGLPIETFDNKAKHDLVIHVLSKSNRSERA